MALELNNGNFEQEVVNSGKIALVDFWATDCPQCARLSPIIDQLAEELAGSVVVGKVNVYEGDELPMKYGIQALPTVFIFKDGKIVGESFGMASKEKLLGLIESVK